MWQKICTLKTMRLMKIVLFSSFLHFKLPFFISFILSVFLLSFSLFSCAASFISTFLSPIKSLGLLISWVKVSLHPASVSVFPALPLLLCYLTLRYWWKGSLLDKTVHVSALIFSVLVGSPERMVPEMQNLIFGDTACSWCPVFWVCKR